MNIKALRAMSKSDLSVITSAFEKEANPESGSKSYEDTRFWKLERDKAGNGTATIRFLPRIEGDTELPWVKLFSHGFKGPTGRWYIENSLTTIGKPDPLSELNMRLWNSTTDDNSPERKQVRAQKRKLNYISNILVINDPKHPENNGKVFLFKYGKKIFDKIMDKARPTFEDETPVNVFDYWEGANFKLRMKTIDKYPNYDASEFESVSALGSDDDIINIANQQYTLSNFLEPSNFKSYDELKKKLENVLSGAPIMETAMDVVEHENSTAAPRNVGKTVAPPAIKTKETSKASFDDDDEDALSYFQSIADND